MNTYRSKIGLELTIPIGLLFGGLITVFILNRQWGGLIPLGATAAFIIIVLTNIRYTINGTTLTVTCRPLYRTTIPIDSIISITATKNPLSAPAASLDRMEIRYNVNSSILISPKEKQAFLEHLRQINPQIKVSID